MDGLIFGRPLVNFQPELGNDLILRIALGFQVGNPFRNPSAGFIILRFAASDHFYCIQFPMVLVAAQNAPIKAPIGHPAGHGEPNRVTRPGRH
jgi:hypothetical protein